MTTATVPNPIVRTTALRVAPGWEVREYADGTFDANQLNGLGLGPVEDSFGAAVYFARHGEPVMIGEARAEVLAAQRVSDDYRNLPMAVLARMDVEAA